MIRMQELGCHVFWCIVLIISVPVIRCELQANNDGQACLHGSSGSSSSCGTPGAIESDSSILQDPAHSSSSTIQSQQEAGGGWAASGRPCPATTQSRSCRRLPASCLACRFNASCVYGANVTALCRPADGVSCTGVREFNRSMVCAYCYQTPSWQHECSLCNVMARGRQYYRANCTVHEDVLCMGRRTFRKSLFCKWTKGDRWSTALTLSIILGGFGVDRFYLGHWQEAIGKFFSFGGLGVWTLIDVVLIAIGYLSPADGSLYMT